MFSPSTLTTSAVVQLLGSNLDATTASMRTTIQNTLAGIVLVAGSTLRQMIYDTCIQKNVLVPAGILAGKARQYEVWLGGAMLTSKAA